MGGEALERLNRLLDRVLDIAPEDRLQFVESLPPEDDDLKERLRQALSTADASSSLETLPRFDTLVAVPGAEEADAKAAPTVGPYRIIRKIADGGMGSVWLAQRADGMLKRPVALKLPLGAWAGSGFAARLAREREILAGLNHPHIARLYDAGLTEGGAPYLALEYVDGRSIDVYCRETGLELRGRLRLFLQVARAVAHAHALLVVHRDLKPSNILVTADGSVKLLDFGIAKLLDPDDRGGTVLTRGAGPPLTPAYASPEQRAGGPLTVGADIYSLGVVLYELLTGERPHAQGEGRGRASQVVTTEEPRPPSARVTTPAERRLLRGDLDTVVLKALKNAPTERYATVDGFAADIERFLAGRPVLAQPDTARYRMARFAARHRLALAAGAAALLAVLAGAGMAIWQARVAIAERQRAEEVKEFIADIFRAADPLAGEGRALSGVEILKQARARVDRSLAARPDLQLELLGIIGSSLVGLQDYQAAEEVLKAALAEPAAALAADDPLVVRVRVMLADAYRMLGRTKEMTAELSILEAAFARDPVRFAEDLPTIEKIRAHLAIDQGRYAEAHAAAESAHQEIVTRFGRDHPSAVETALLRAVAYQYGAEPAKALSTAEEAYSVAVAVHDSNLVHPRVIDARGIYGRALGNDGRLDEGIAQLSQAVQDASALFGEAAPMVAFYSADLAKYQVETGDIRAALESAHRSFAMIKGLAQPDSFTYAGAAFRLGLSQLAARQAKEAAAQLALAVSGLERAMGAGHDRTRLARAYLGLALAYASRMADADRQVEPFEDLPPDAGASLAVEGRRVAGVVHRLAGRHELAIRLQQAALETLASGRADDRARMRSLAEIGFNHLALGELEQARQALEDALGLFGRLQSQPTPEQADALAGLGLAHLARRQPAEALLPLERADRFWKTFDERHPDGLEAARALAECYAVLGRTSDADAAAARARRLSTTAR
jgi:eukaryotic-like serine/threonine-protein kinase